MQIVQLIYLTTNRAITIISRMGLQNAQSNALIDAREAARRLGVSPSTVRRWAYEGSIPVVRLPSGRMRFRLADIQALLEPTPSAPSTPDDVREVDDDFNEPLPGFEGLGQ